jgi:hypothetical protein
MMDLILLKCCRKTIHQQCLVAYLGINSQCLYCRRILDLAKILEEPIIDRSVLAPTTPVTKTPIKSNLHDMLMVDERTRKKEADRVRSLSQEKKRLAQLIK